MYDRPLKLGMVNNASTTCTRPILQEENNNNYLQNIQKIKTHLPWCNKNKTQLPVTSKSVNTCRGRSARVYENGPEMLDNQILMFVLFVCCLLLFFCCCFFVGLRVLIKALSIII